MKTKESDEAMNQETLAARFSLTTRRKTAAMWLCAGLILVAGNGLAATYDASLGTWPTNQGWQLRDQGGSQAYLTNGVLRLGPTTTGGDYSYYQTNIAVSYSSGFTMSARLRILNSTTSGTGAGFVFDAFDGTGNRLNLSIGNGVVFLNSGAYFQTNATVQFATTNFADYSVVAANGTASLFINGIKRTQITLAVDNAAPQWARYVLFGDVIGALTCTVDIQSFSHETSAHYPAGIDPGLIAWYPFDGDANDASGSGRHGAPLNGTNFVAGKLAQAIHLNGTNQYVDFPAFAPPTNYTVALWVKLDTERGDSKPMNIFGVWYQNQGAYLLDYWHQSGTDFRVRAAVWTGGGWQSDDNCRVRLATNNWYHLAMIYNGSTKVLSTYVNGQLGSSLPNVPAPSSDHPAGSECRLGRSWLADASADYLAGTVDDLRVYSRALSRDEVRELAGLPPLPPLDADPSLVAWYPFDGNANDASGNGHNGTTNGVTPTLDRTNGVNGALAFDGNDSVSLGTAGSILKVPTVTFSCWMFLNPDRPAGTEVVFGAYAGGTFTDGQTIVRVDNLTPSPYAKTNGVILQYGTGNGLGHNRAFDAKISAGAWHHFVAVMDNSQSQASLRSKVYVDGVEITDSYLYEADDATLNAPIGNTAKTLWIGRCDITDSAVFLRGKLDDVRIYKRALSASEVVQLYTGYAATGTVTATLSNVTWSSYSPQNVRFALSGASSTVTNSGSNPCTFTNVTNGNYTLQGWQNASNEWNAAELWAQRDFTVQNGQATNVLLQRDLPFKVTAETYRNPTTGAAIPAGSQVLLGTPVAIDVTVTNGTGTSQTVELTQRMTVNTAAAPDFAPPSRSIIVPAYSTAVCSFTNSDLELGVNYQDYRIRTALSSYTVTDSGAWSLAFTVLPANSVTATLANVNVSYSSYTPQNVTWSIGGQTGSGNPATIQGIPTGSQAVKACQDGGTPFGKEQWVETTATVAAGSQSMTFVRNLPYGEIHIFRGASQIGWGSQLNIGDQLTVKVTIHNPASVDYRAFPSAIVTTNRGETAYYYQNTFMVQTIPAGGSVDFTDTLFVNAAGSWQHSYCVFTTVQGVATLTDSADWYYCFRVDGTRMTPSAVSGDFATDSTVPLGNKVPLVLVHGSGNDCKPATYNYWKWWLEALNKPPYSSVFKVYRYIYATTNHIAANGTQLAAFVNECPEFANRHVLMLAHSMGGLVCRYALNTDTPFRNKTVKLVTLATPHLGSPGADPCWVYEVSQVFGTGVGPLIVEKAYANEPRAIDGLPGSFDLAWWNPNDILPDAWQQSTVTKLSSGDYRFDENLMTNAMNNPFTGTPSMTSAIGDGKLVAFAGYNYPEYVGGLYQRHPNPHANILPGAASSEAETLMDHTNLASAVWALAQIHNRAGFHYTTNDGLVPFESAMYSTHLAEGIQAFDLSALLQKNLDHASFLDDADVHSFVGSRLLSLASGVTGGLSVSLSPSSAAAAGAQWQVDGGTWHASADVVSGLSEGMHTVHFSAVSGWLAPPDTSVNVVYGQTASAQGSYVLTDHVGPQLTVSYSLNGNKTTASLFQLYGTASDASAGASGIASVTVNGVPATGGQAISNAVANWSYNATLALGSNTFTIVATDASPDHNTTTQTVAIIRGQGPSINGLSDQTVLAGQSATLSASVTGNTPLSYQWFKSGAPITGANGSVLPFNPATRADTANYSLTVTNEFDTSSAGPVRLTVTAISRLLTPAIVDGNTVRLEFEPSDGIPFTAMDARGYAVEASDSLASWTRLSVSLQAVNGRIRADIPLAPADGKKFYRIVKP